MNKNFSLLVIGQSLANIGDVLYMVSIISMIFTLTGSATVASLVPFTVTTSMFLSTVLTPLLVGRVNLKWLLSGSQLGKTGLILGLGLLVVGISESNYYVVFIIIAGIALLDGCANPIRQTLIPHYVESQKLLRANGIAESITQFIQTVMWFVGSLFLVIMSPQQVIWLVVLLFALSSMLLTLLSNVEQPAEEHESMLSQLKEGWHTVFKTPVLRKIALMEIMETLAGTVWIAAILYVFVSDALQADEKWWGFVNGSFFLGLVAGSMYCIKNSDTIESRIGNVLFIGALSSCLINIFFSITSNPFLALGLSFGFGLFEQIRGIPMQTVIQTSVAKGKLSTVYTSLGAISTGIFGIGSVVMGVLADLLGVRSVFLFSGLLLAIVTLLVFRNKLLFIRNTAQ
ncbi:MFS transporter [Sporosarcina sp. NCCP-2716]|uniref:MFS transporter n=1 Tax=Sporosarcina sp. NCCP-2716 TaxID=2943679 RepID=UPI0020885A59|nr:MFS transporter [Sporosarcina sp. NCCP-2716]GKV69284.1 MFS transporter [Sporosarcina sp. NCCP-2716]